MDGNTAGNYPSAPIVHTNYDVNAWWQVDLGGTATITGIQIWNRTDCCGDRENDYWIFVSNTPFSPSDTPANLQYTATWSSHQTAIPNPSTFLTLNNVHGRYVRVQLSGTNYLNFAELQVWGTLPDLALGKAATQSSTIISTTGAANAVDGNTAGNYPSAPIAHTNYDQYAWWQVDLGATATITGIQIWNRTDCCGDRENDYWVFVSNTQFSPLDTPANLQYTATWSKSSNHDSEPLHVPVIEQCAGPLRARAAFRQ